VPAFAAVRAEPGPPPSAGRDVVYAGRLSPEKGADVLVDAWARLSSAPPDARLVLIGDGPERARLAAMAEAAGRPVVLPGALPADETQRRLATARVVVVPSRHEDSGPVPPVHA